MAVEQRILELALKGLLAERDRIAFEIEELRARLGGRVATARRRRATKAIKREVSDAAGRATRSVKKKIRKRKKMSASQRKLISEKMKAAWARRKRQGG